MESCSTCGKFLLDGTCPYCAQALARGVNFRPNVTWDEIEDHLHRRLHIDEAASVKRDKEYFWWPGFLCQHVYQADEGQFGSDSEDNWLLVVGETEIATMSEDLGLKLADEVNTEFVHGAAIYENERLRLRTAYAFNPLNRGMLKIFHEQLLAQVTLAHEFALRWENLDGVELSYSSHPESGPRAYMDELMAVFWGETYQEPIVDNFQTALTQAREIVPGIMFRNGWEPGFSNEEVNFFIKDNASVGIGVRPMDPENKKYGPGIFIFANDLRYQSGLDVGGSNFLNLITSSLERSSQFGAFASENASGGSAARITAFYPYGPLAEDRFNPVNMAIEITNFAAHVSNSCMLTFEKAMRLGR